MSLNNNSKKANLLPTAQTSILTIIAISIFVWVLKSVTHEMIGHGGAYFLLGKEWQSVSTIWFHGAESVSLWEIKFRLAVILAFLAIL